MKLTTYTNRTIKFLLLRKSFILAFILFFVVLSCSKSTDAPTAAFTPQNIPFSLIGSGPYSGNAATSNLVIQNNTQWSILMNELTPNVTNQFTETSIDFNNFFLIAIIDQVRPNTSFSVNIANIIENENNIVVRVNSSSSGSGYNVLTQPFRIVKIAIQTKPFVFQ